MATRKTPAKTTTRRARDRARAVQALQLKSAGHTYDAIATELGYANRGTAQAAVQNLLNNMESESVDEHRALQLERLMWLLDKNSRAIEDAREGREVGLAQLISSQRGIEERIAKLLGLDAALQIKTESTVVVKSAIDTEIEQLVHQMRESTVVDPTTT